ncbi:MAG: hypothetical protein QOG64_1095 [Acidimicrobiaceae bacterium]|nr:hypothetical protein [Acidimicrobiaceae bacterium]
MTQPDYVPIKASDRVRPAERLPPAGSWRPDRPGDLRTPGMPTGPRLGHQGPDLGYGMKLARRFADRLVLSEGESVDDAVAGCFSVGCKRSSLFGRGPVIYDYELTFTVWGFLGKPPADLVAFRKPLFQGADHHYEVQRDIADHTPESTLRLSPAEVAARMSEWRTLLTV